MIFVRTRSDKQKRIAIAVTKLSEREQECRVFGPGNDEVNDYIFVESYEELSELIGSEKKLILQSSIHIWNFTAVEAILSLGIPEFHFLASYELTEHELMDLYRILPGNVTMILPVYGRIPLMYTKNCVKLTNGLCNKTSEFVKIKDRKRVDFPIYSDCEKCRNIIYNSVPLSLHNHVKSVQNFKDIYIEFTDEDEDTVEAVMKYYLGLIGEFPLKNYTTGHFKKPVL